MKDIIWEASMITMVIGAWSICRCIKYHFTKVNETIINVGLALGLTKEDALLLVEKVKDED